MCDTIPKRVFICDCSWSKITFAEMLTQGLLTEGYAIDHLVTCGEANAALSTNRYAALILDLALPDGDGLSILQEVRRRNQFLPVLVVTARSSVPDRVGTLRSGADDYLVKPFHFDELLARLEALLRRPGQILEHSLQISNLKFDPECRQAFIDDKLQILFSREATILELLMRYRQQVVTKKLLEDQIFGKHSGAISSNAVEVYVHRLRKALSDNGAKVVIQTVRGVGYLLKAEA